MPTRLRHALWGVALLKVFVPPFWTWPGGNAAGALGTVSELALFMQPIASDVTSPSGPATAPATWLFLLWLTSVFGFGLVVLARNAALRVGMRGARAVAVPTPEPGLRVYECGRVRAPMTVGLVCPRVYLPLTWRTWSRSQLQGVLQHEWAHIASGDVWILLAEYVALALFLGHPLVWLVHRKLDEVRELRCDESVLRVSRLGPAKYSRFLLSLAEQEARPERAGLLRKCFSNTVFLRRRINHILTFQEERMTHYRKTFIVVLPLVFVGAAVLLSWKCNRTTITEPEKGERVLGKDFQFQAFDEAPEPVGGFAAIGQNLRYPEAAKEAGVEAKVILHVLVDQTGQVVETRVLKGADRDLGFDEAAARAVKRVRWRPARQNGNPVPAWVALPVIFNLEETDQEALIRREWPRPASGMEAFEAGLRQTLGAEGAERAGRLVLELAIDASGKVVAAKVTETSGDVPEGFVAEALRSVKGVRWEPAKRNGRPVGMLMLVGVRFRIGEGGTTVVIAPVRKNG